MEMAVYESKWISYIQMKNYWVWNLMGIYETVQVKSLSLIDHPVITLIIRSAYLF